jgi:Pectinacetylesterase
MRMLKLGHMARSALLVGALVGCAETSSDTDGGSVGLPGNNGSVPDGGGLGGGSFGDGSVTGPVPGFDAGPGVIGGGTQDGGPVGGGGGSVDGGATDAGGSPLTAALPTGKGYANGWTWVDVPGSKCRDGSGAGYYWRRGSENKLLVYLNGGGACADPFFCNLNPVNVNQDLPTELLFGATGNLLVAKADDRRQEAPNEGIFKKDARNPVQNWNMIYVPYCTGDIHAGSRENVTVPGVDKPQNFTGFTNLGLFLKSFGPSFMSAEKVLLTGSSAGGFGSLLNYDRFATYFTGSTVLAISDSGLPFRDPYMAACLQKRWRQYWGLNDAFPADCTACKGTDGGLTEAAFNYYFKNKYQGKFLGGYVTKVNDQIIRAFFAPGLNSSAGQPDNCTLDPFLNTVVSAIGFNSYSGEKYREALADLTDKVVDPSQLGYYAMPGEEHMHLWRPRYFEKNGNTQSIAEWVADIINMKPTKQGDNVLHGK